MHLLQSCFEENVSIVISFGPSDPLLVVRDYTAEEIGVGVPQSGHEFGERLLIKLTHGPEHSLLGL